MKKTIFYLLALLVTMSMILTLGACNSDIDESQTDSNSTVPSESATEEPSDPFMKYEPAIDMFVGQFVGNDQSFPSGEDPTSNAAYDLIREHVGVNFVPLFTAPFGGPYHERLKLAISTDDIPDMSFCSIDELEMLIKGDMIEDLTPYYEKYASENLKKLLGYNNDVSFTAAVKDGKIMALPSVVDASNGVALMYIRQDWLDTLDLPVPSTMEEVFETAGKFVENDMGTSGTRGYTIGISFSKEFGEPFNAMMNAFGAYPGIFLNDGDSVKYGSVQPEVKDVLLKMNELYAAGIFDKEIAIIDGNKAAQYIAAGRVGIYFGQFWNPLWPLHDTVKNNADADWVCYPVPGAQGVEHKPYSPLNVNGYYYVRKGYANPEAIIIAMNHFIEGMFGNENEFGLAWSEKEKSDTYRGRMMHSWLPFFVDRPDKNLQYSQNLVKAVEANDESLLTSTAEIDLFKQMDISDINNWPWHKIYLNSIPALNEYEERMFNAYLGAPTATMTQIGSVLAAKEEEAFISIIVGEKPITAFDAFVQEWKSLGGDKIIQEIESQK